MKKIDELMERLNNPSVEALTRLYSVFTKAGIGGVIGGVIDFYNNGGDGNTGFLIGAVIGGASHGVGFFIDRISKIQAGNDLDNSKSQLEEDRYNAS